MRPAAGTAAGADGRRHGTVTVQLLRTFQEDEMARAGSAAAKRAAPGSDDPTGVAIYKALEHERLGPQREALAHARRQSQLQHEQADAPAPPPRASLASLLTKCGCGRRSAGNGQGAVIPEDEPEWSEYPVVNDDDDDDDDGDDGDGDGGGHDDDGDNTEALAVKVDGDAGAEDAEQAGGDTLDDLPERRVTLSDLLDSTDKLQSDDIMQLTTEQQSEFVRLGATELGGDYRHAQAFVLLRKASRPDVYRALFAQVRPRRVLPLPAPSATTFSHASHGWFAHLFVPIDEAAAEGHVLGRQASTGEPAAAGFDVRGTAKEVLRDGARGARAVRRRRAAARDRSQESPRGTGAGQIVGRGGAEASRRCILRTAGGA